MQLADIIIISILYTVMAILVIAAISDIRHRRIPNILPIILIILYSIFALMTHFHDDAYQLNVIDGVLTGGILLACGLVLFALGAMGAGDIKLAAALGLFAGSQYITAFLILMTLSGGLLSGVVWVHMKLSPKQNKVDGANRHSVPYGVAISISGIWLCIQLLHVANFAIR